MFLYCYMRDRTLKGNIIFSVLFTEIVHLNAMAFILTENNQNKA